MLLMSAEWLRIAIVNVTDKFGRGLLMSAEWLP